VAIETPTSEHKEDEVRVRNWRTKIEIGRRIVFHREDVFVYETKIDSFCYFYKYYYYYYYYFKGFYN